MRVARVYMRVSTQGQDLDRQNRIVDEAKNAGFYIAGIYREKASGANADRPDLKRMISDLQSGEVVIAEKMDRISRLPLPEAEALIGAISSKGAKLAIPGVVDLTETVEDATGVTKIVLESVQSMLLRLALQIARDDYETRRERQREGIERGKAKGVFRGKQPNKAVHERVLALRQAGYSIATTAKLAGCSTSTVKRVWSEFIRTKNNT